MLYEVKKLDPIEGHPVEAFLKDIAEKMGIDLSFSVKEGNDIVFVEITGKDTGTIIGKRGATLDAVQCLASYVVNKDQNKSQRKVFLSVRYPEIYKDQNCQSDSRYNT